MPERLQRSVSGRPRRRLHQLGLYQLGPHQLRASQIVVIVLALSTQPLTLAEAEVLDLAQPATTVVTVTKAEPQASYPLEQVFVGRVEARRSAELGFERPGQLIEVRVREGDRVEADTLLARLDPSLLQAKRAELLADLASAEADLALAEATANRYRNSVKDGAVTRQDLDEASEGARAASARLQLAEARIASIDLDLSKTELRAPFDGTVIHRSADEGTILSAGQPVLRVQETATPEIRIGVAGLLLEALQPGQRYNLEIDGETVPTQLRAIIPLRVGASRTVDALFDPVGPSIEQPVEQAAETSELQALETTQNDREAVEALAQDVMDKPARGPERSSVLRPGNLAELRLSKQVEAEGFWLPLSALSEGERGLWRALVAELETEPETEPETANPHDQHEPQHAESSAYASDVRWRLVSRPVQVLHVDSERVFVRGALQPGDLVVAAGLHRVVPGQWVQLAPAGGDSADKAH